MTKQLKHITSKEILLLMLFFSFYTSAFSQCVVDYSKLTLRFNEDFNGTLLDNTKWIVRDDPNFCPSVSDDFIFTPATCNNGTCQPTANVFLSNGNLNLCAIRQPGTAVTATGCPTGTKTTVNYTSGLIRTDSSYLYGYFEARCKMSAGGGTFPAFWLFRYPGDEIDIFEFSGDHPNQFSNTVHDWPYPSSPSPHPYCSDIYRLDKCRDLTQDFHTYGMAWTPQYVTFFFDGKEIRTMDVSTFFSQVCPGSNDNCPMYVYLNLGMETWATTSSATFTIDYVNIYSINDYANYKKENITQMNWPANSIKISSQNKSVSIGENDQIFFKDPNGWAATAYYSNGWNLAYLTRTWSQTEVSGGDVVVGENNEVFFRGTDGKLHRYYWSNNTWNHDVPGNNSNISISISSTPGSISVGKCNQVYVKDINGWVACYTPYGGSGSSANYQGNYLTTTWNTLEIASGDIVAGVNEVYYRSSTGKINQYGWSSNAWHFQQIGQSWPSVYNVSDQSGSIWLSVQPNPDANALSQTFTQIFYRGADNWIQNVYWNTSITPNAWSHGYLTNNFSDQTQVAGGNITGTEDHIFYIATDGKIHQYAWTSLNGWTPQNLNIPVQSNLVAREMNHQLFYRGSNEFLNNYFWRTCADLKTACNVGYSLRLASGNGVPGNAKGMLYEIEIFPNPVNDKLNVSITSDQSIFNKLEIMDVSGKIIREYEISSDALEISIQDLSPGLYFAKFGGLDKIEMRKIIKQ